MTPEDIANRFDYHAPDEARRQAHELVRARCRALAESINDILVECREKALAVTKLEDVMFWSNAAIARQKD